MANIDNTVLAQILKKMGGFKTQIRTWEAVWRVAQAERTYNVIANILKGFEEEIEEVEEKARIEGRKRVNDINELVTYSDDSTKQRFFNGMKKPNDVHRSWWPQSIDDFDEVLQIILNHYVINKYKNDDTKEIDKETIWEDIQHVCKKCGVPENKIQEILESGEDYTDWFDYMIHSAIEEYQMNTVAQYSIYRKKRRTFSQPSSTTASYHDPSPIPSSKASIAHPSTSLTAKKSDIVVLSPHISALEGTELKDSDPSFPKWAESHIHPIVAELKGSLVFDDGDFQDLPYIELYGSAMPGREEFIDGVNIFFHHLDVQSDIRSSITTLDFTKSLGLKRAEAEKIGYLDHPKKMWLYQINELQSASIAGLKSLNFYLGSTDYLEHKVFEEELKINSKLREDLRFKLSGIRGRADEVLVDEPWTRIGAGIWIIAKDDNGNRHLIMSFRNPRKVAEVPSVLSYSSSGSIDLDDKTPTQGILREFSEELALPRPAPNEITLISIGIDTSRFVLQLSYVWESPYTIAQVMRYKQSSAVSAGEQITLSVPFNKEPCVSILSQLAMEPGAAYSLMRLIQKNF